MNQVVFEVCEFNDLYKSGETMKMWLTKILDVISVIDIFLLVRQND